MIVVRIRRERVRAVRDGGDVAVAVVVVVPGQHGGIVCVLDADVGYLQGGPICRRGRAAILVVLGVYGVGCSYRRLRFQAFERVVGKRNARCAAGREREALACKFSVPCIFWRLTALQSMIE